MKRMLLSLLYTVYVLSAVGCSNKNISQNTYVSEPPMPSHSQLELKPMALPSAVPELIETVTVYNASTWNDFARSYNSEREKYADSVTVEITSYMDFQNTAFVPLRDGFSGRIVAYVPKLSPERLDSFKRYPVPYEEGGIFRNIHSIDNIEGKAASSLFGSTDDLSLENISFVNIVLDNVDCLLTENTSDLKLSNVKISNCILYNARAIAAVSAENFSADGLLVNQSILRGLDFSMAGLVVDVSGNASFKDIHMYRSSFMLCPDTGSSWFWSAGISLLAYDIEGAASFENIEFYACTAEGLYIQALANSVGILSECSDISLDLCTFMNYKKHTQLEFCVIISGVYTESYQQFMEHPVIEENISLTNSIFTSGYSAEDYAKRGYNIENCLFTRSDTGQSTDTRHELS